MVGHGGLVAIGAEVLLIQLPLAASARGYWGDGRWGRSTAAQHSDEIHAPGSHQGGGGGVGWDR